MSGNTENIIKFRPCEECNACCNGSLQGVAHGKEFGNGIPCAFLQCEKCTIYPHRPSTCINYQCAWSQHLFDEDMRPDKLGIMVSVERKGDQYLKAIEIRPFVSLEAHKRVEQWAQKLQTNLVKIHYNYRIEKDGELV